jgi:pilus assembly protein CpaF
MGELNQLRVSPNVPASSLVDERKKRADLAFKAQQELKTTIHRDLLNKVDLEKVATVRDERTRRQVLVVIQELVANLKTPLSGPEKERLHSRCWTKSSVWALRPLHQRSTISDIWSMGTRMYC